MGFRLESFIGVMGSSLNQGPFLGPQKERHPSKKVPKRDTNLENYPYGFRVLSVPQLHEILVAGAQNEEHQPPAGTRKGFGGLLWVLRLRPLLVVKCQGLTP